MYSVTKKLKDASICHRLGKGYPNACKNLHGHSYHFEITVETRELNEYDMSIDFGEIKKKCDNWIQDNWDHGTLVSRWDLSFISFLKTEKMKYYVMEENTTAELMSEYLLDKFKNYFGKCNMTIRVWETDTSYATATTKEQ